ncbi:hypothetical protein [Sodalis glossinidius]|uniref:hypothetical protein n=1 Tax=Sodalis glossinidius TaxID=63612 RepID=UPI000682E975|nr:hypothetical protein [Sodalis glossinidius]
MALVNYVAEKQNAIANTLNIVRNKFSFYGVSGVNHSALNDPSLPTPITPVANASKKTQWKDKTIQERYNDILALYGDLVGRTHGAVGDGVDMASPLKLVLSNQASVYLKSANESFNTSLEDMIKKAFLNLVIETAPQFSTDAGELMQMFLPEWGGQPHAMWPSRRNTARIRSSPSRQAGSRKFPPEPLVPSSHSRCCLLRCWGFNHGTKNHCWMPPATRS